MDLRGITPTSIGGYPFRMMPVGSVQRPGGILEWEPDGDTLVVHAHLLYADVPTAAGDLFPEQELVSDATTFTPLRLGN